ncbi:MAG: autotransporter outer membrane beta-barrel domain-containing protein [Verrucomicrobia bacterium]|nr:autotransporter outer membrane beta-barrel domain-containing protein [Verrucomicrobiota bacterium]
MTFRPLTFLGCIALTAFFVVQPLRAQTPPGFSNPFLDSGTGSLVPEISNYYTTVTPGVRLLTTGTRVLSDYGAAYQMGFSSAEILQANIENRLEDIRVGAPGFSPALGGQNWLSKNPTLTPVPDTPAGTFVIGTGDFVNISGENGVPSYDFYTAGFILGADYRPTPGFVIGISGNYYHGHTDFTSQGPFSTAQGRVDADSGGGGIYATYFERGFYLNGYAGGAYSSYDFRRSVGAATNSGSTSGSQFNGFLGTGFDFRKYHWTFGPIASLAYTSMQIDSFDESRNSGGLVPLRLFGESQQSFRTNLGFRVLKDFPMGKFGLYPELRVSWQHEYLYNSLPVDARLANGFGGAFSFTGPSLGRDSVLVHFGLQLRVGDQWKGFAAYDGDLGRDHYLSNAVSGGISYSF